MRDCDKYLHRCVSLRADMSELLLDLQADLTAIEAESIGWQPLGDGAYLPRGKPEALVIEVVGVPRDGDAVLLVGW